MMLVHHRASAGGTSTSQLQTTPIALLWTPPRFRRWYFNFIATNGSALPRHSFEVEAPPAKAWWCPRVFIRRCSYEVEAPPAKAWWCVPLIISPRVTLTDNGLELYGPTKCHLPQTVIPDMP